MKVVGVIPARGSSTRVKNKNIRDLNGSPLIVWTINDLLDSNLIDEVYVTTDSKYIKEIAIDYGAKVIDRPKNISDELSQIEPALIHALGTIEEDVDILGTFQCTTPFREVADIDRGIQKMIETNSDSLLFVCENDKFLWTREPKPINYDYKNRVRSQDNEWDLVECGDYLTKPSLLFETNNRIGGKINYLIVNKLSSFDIDTELDLKIANGIAKEMGLHAEN